MINLPFDIEKTILINKPSSEVFSYIANFENWPSWSPWLRQEPECSFRVKNPAGKVNHRQEWEGKYIGSGTMEIESIKPGEAIYYNLHFMKPWKSQSKVSFELSKKDADTLVTWTMKGSIPVFLFFMKRMMSALVGSDYKRGLAMLKERLEEGEVHSKVVRVGKVDQNSFHYIGLENTCEIENIGPTMESDFQRLTQFRDSKDIDKNHSTFCIYHDFDFVKEKARYSVCFGYEKELDIEPEGDVYIGELPNHKALQYNHIGAYKHLQNAWSAVMGSARVDKLKTSKDLKPYEIYSNDPREVAESEIKTEIYVPLR